MRAVVAQMFGGPEVLELVEIETPAPGPGQVTVDVVTAGLNPVDAMMRRGEMGGPAPLRLGTEFAGVVREVGPGVTQFAAGNDVIGFGTLGSYAEVVVSNVTQLAPKPAALSWEVAGGLSGVGQTALTVLETLRLPAGSTLLVHGASGGVGSILVQLAVTAGLKVIGTASASNHDHLRDLGAVPLAYGEGLAARIRAVAPKGVDAAVEMGGEWQNVEASLEFVPVERIVSLLPATARNGVRFVGVQRSSERLTWLANEVVSGRLHAEVQEVFDLADVPRAHAQLDTKHNRGKLILRTRGA